MAAQEEMQDTDFTITDALPADVAQLAGIVLADETLNSVLSKVTQLTKKVMPAADEVSLTLVLQGRAETAAYTGEMAMQLGAAPRRLRADERPLSAGQP